MAGNVRIVLEDGEDIYKSIKEVMKESKIDYGMVETGKGAIKDFELVSHGQRGTVENFTHKKEFEVNAMSGKLQRVGKDYRIKVNILISSSGFTPQSGELIAGKAAGRLEITIKKIDLGKMIEA